MYHLFQESVDLLELHPPEDEDVDSCISHAYTLSLALRALNQWERACEVLERGLRLARLYAHTRGHCMLLHVFGGLELYRGDYAAALARWDEVECLCRDRLRARQDDMLEIIALGQGLALAGLRKYDEAIATLRRVGRRAEETGDKDQRWYAHSNLTYITLYTGDTATASRMLQESLERYEASNHSSGLLTYHEQRFLLDLLVSGTHAPTPSLLFRETQTRADSNVSTRAQLYRCILDRTLEDFPEWPINEVISEQVWSLLRARLEGKEAELASGAPSVHAIERALLSLLQDTPTLWSREDFASISVDDQDTWIDLKSRPIARSILRQLAASAPRPVNSWHLLESTWPDIIVRDATALNRLYTNIHRLRAMGLQDVLIREGDGYRLTRCKAV